MTTLYSIPLISGAIGGSLPPLNRSNHSEFGPHPDPKQGAGRRRRHFWGPVDFEIRRSFDPFSGGLGLDDASAGHSSRDKRSVTSFVAWRLPVTTCFQRKTDCLHVRRKCAIKRGLRPSRDLGWAGQGKRRQFGSA